MISGKMEMDTDKQYTNINTMQEILTSLYTQIGKLDDSIVKFCGNSASGQDVVEATTAYEKCREDGDDSISGVMKQFAIFTHNVRVNYNDLVKLTNGLD